MTSKKFALRLSNLLLFSMLVSSLCRPAWGENMPASKASDEKNEPSEINAGKVS
jgi:hypothetical protein